MDLDASAYAFDSTTIDLCLNLFRWAKFRRTKGAIKLHTLPDLRGSIPTFIHISDGKLHDVNALDLLPIEPGSFYVMDRGYLDFERLHAFQDLGAPEGAERAQNYSCAARIQLPLTYPHCLRQAGSHRLVFGCFPGWIAEDANVVQHHFRNLGRISATYMMP